MDKQSYFKSLEYIPASSLSGMQMLDNDLCRIPTNVNFTSINTYGLIEVTLKVSLENKQVINSVTCTFRTRDKKSFKGRHLAFRLTATDGTQHLIGTYTRPYAIIEENIPYPSKPTESTLKTVKITYKATHPMLYIAD